MKKIRIAINGFGRIGRSAFKVAVERRDLDVVAINDLSEPATLAHLLRYDTAYGTYDRQVRVQEKTLVVGSTRAVVLAQKDPSKLPWKKLGIDVVLECTGRFTDRESAGLHLKAGARRVILSAPPKGSGVSTVVLGVNDQDADKGSRVLSNASCTTNCISPVAAVIHEKFGIKKATMTTIHSYTADQNLQDGPHRDLRRARAAAENIVPTSTGAAVSTTEIIPELAGLFDGLSIRVPTPVVSLSDFTILLKKRTTVEALNRAFESAARSPRYRGILAVTKEPLVSSDFIKNPASAIVDLSLTSVVDGDLAKIVAWYDNEWGYSNRLVELAVKAGRGA
jgi:glyceraldehyde 3-phosphate dehydrogenase